MVCTELPKQPKGWVRVIFIETHCGRFFLIKLWLFINAWPPSSYFIELFFVFSAEINKTKPFAIHYNGGKGVQCHVSYAMLLELTKNQFSFLMNHLGLKDEWGKLGTNIQIYHTPLRIEWGERFAGPCT